MIFFLLSFLLNQLVLTEKIKRKPLLSGHPRDAKKESNTESGLTATKCKIKFTNVYALHKIVTKSNVKLTDFVLKKLSVQRLMRFHPLGFSFTGASKQRQFYIARPDGVRHLLGIVRLQE